MDQRKFRENKNLTFFEITKVQFLKKFVLYKIFYLIKEGFWGFGVLGFWGFK